MYYPKTVLKKRLISTARYLLILLFAAIMISCSEAPVKGKVDMIPDYEFTLQSVPYGELFKNRERLFNTNTATPKDSNGVYLFPYEGGLYYHPVNLSFKSLEALSDFHHTADIMYLNHAEKTMETLRREAIRHEDMLYFPYKFNFSEGSQVTYQAPWYSGMAQGAALSAYCRLYHFTGKPLYKSVADSILATFVDFDSPYSCVLIAPWNTHLKQSGYYWIDEYPSKTRRYVLNGSIIGAMGLYDHWWVFKDNYSKKLFSCEMTSIKDNALLYRNPGHMSAYCLLYRNTYANYHLVHRQLFDLCAKLTGDEYFTSLSELFYEDSH